MKRVHIVLHIFMLASTILAHGNQRLFKQFTTANGLSNNRVYSILQDTLGFLWIGTLDGLNRYDGYNFKVYKNIPHDSSSLPVNRVMNIYQDTNGCLWLISKNAGISCFNPQLGSFKHISNKQEKEQLPQWFINSVHGVKILNAYNGLAEKIHRQYNLKVTFTSFLKTEGFLWLGTQQNSLFRVNLANNKIDHFTTQPFKKTSFIRAIYQDSFGTIWIGTNNDGLLKYTPAHENFKYLYQFNTGEKIIEGITVRAINQTSNGDILIGTFNQGIVKYSETSGLSTHLPNLWPGQNTSGQVRAIYNSDKTGIWVGGYFGLSNLSNNLNIKNHLRFYYNVALPNTDDCRVYNITEDYFGNLWLANWDNLVKYNPATEKTEYIPKSTFNVDNIRVLTIDNNNMLWIGCEIGGLIRYNLRNGDFVNITTEQGLSNNNIFHVHEDSRNYIWVSTFHGLNKLNNSGKVLQTYTTNNGLPSNMIYGMLEDSHQNLWVTTSNGLAKIQPDSFTVSIYDMRQGIQDNEFTEGGFFKMPNTGQFVIGGVNGLNIFHPDSILPNTVRPKVIITGLRIMNVPVDKNQLYNGRKIIEQPIEYTNSIELEYSDKIFSFEFSAIHTTMPAKNIYKYKLDGFDKEWMITDANRRFATYTNLAPGNYTFMLKASNSDGVWNNQPIKLKVIINPPLWAEWYAYLSYFIIVILLLLLFRFISLQRIRIKNALKLEKVEREKSEELNKLKLDFFIGISHELRTPLTLIMGPIDAVLKSDLNQPAKLFENKIQLVQRNAQRLLNLVNQIMDISKLDAGKLRICAQEINIEKFIDEILVYYRETVHQYNIHLSFKNNAANTTVYADYDKLDKIIGNLVSNAVKFTPKNGEVSITIEDNKTLPDNHYDIKIGQLPTPQCIEIHVSDSGVGIAPDLLDKIFNRFYQIHHSVSFDMKGTGIGLSLVKDLVEMHHGEILVKSNENHGSLFTIRLPYGKRHFNADEVTGHLIANNDARLSETSITPGDGDIETTVSQKPKSAHILVVEDNTELRQYLESILLPDYIVSVAEHGINGLEKLKTEIPDVIISDIMMPEMDGIEFCQLVKKDINTSHIPFIMLTANTSQNVHIEGLNRGTDDFITKPFKTEVLLARISNLLANRAKLKKYYQQRFTLNEANLDSPPIALSPQDDAFMKKMHEVIEKNIENTSFNVEFLSSELGMSRSNLHKKIKSVTDKNASELIRAVRLKEGMELLKQGHLNVEQVAEKVGFNTSSYFIKYFKGQYGITPKEFLSGKKQSSP